MTTRTTTVSAAARPPAVPAGRIPAEERFARHVRSGARGLRWHYDLGRLALECCPPRVRGRPQRLQALADNNPPCSRSLLYKVMKFASQYPRAEVVALERARVGWDQVATLLSVRPDERAGAIDELMVSQLTSRQVRHRKAERFGAGRRHGGRPTRPLGGHGPELQARELSNDCRRLCARHSITPEVFERVLRGLAAGTEPTPQELAQIRSAAGAVRALLVQFGGLHALLVGIVERCEETPATGVNNRRRGPRRAGPASARREAPSSRRSPPARATDRAA